MISKFTVVNVSMLFIEQTYLNTTGSFEIDHLKIIDINMGQQE